MIGIIIISCLIGLAFLIGVRFGISIAEEAKRKHEQAVKEQIARFMESRIEEHNHLCRTYQIMLDAGIEENAEQHMREINQSKAALIVLGKIYGYSVTDKQL